jgi:hypothetical protein
MEAGGADAADVHAGTLANGLQALEDGDVFGGIRRGHGRRNCKGSRVLGFWGSGVLGFWGSGVLGFWGSGVLRF